MDFTLKKYLILLKKLKAASYSFLTFADYCQREYPGKYLVLRHDVEKRYNTALAFAQIENKLGIQGTYFFRLTKDFDKEVVGKIAALGHEVAYHYDDLSACRGDENKAIKRFKKNLTLLRSIAPVKTMVMEGAPLSKYDNKDLWITHNYRDYGIIGEPYFDVDFDKMFYLTDTGRRWDGWKVSVRDKVPQQEQWIKDGLVYHKTEDIIEAIRSGSFPHQVMMTFHPQRWHSKLLPWFKELVLQNVKNVVKSLLIHCK